MELKVARVEKWRGQVSLKKIEIKEEEEEEEAKIKERQSLKRTKQISPRDYQSGMVRQSNGGGVAEQDRRRKV